MRSLNLWWHVTTYIFWKFVNYSYHTLVNALYPSGICRLPSSTNFTNLRWVWKCEFRCTQEGRNCCHSSLVGWTASSRTWIVVFQLLVTELIHRKESPIFFKLDLHLSPLSPCAKLLRSAMYPNSIRYVTRALPTPHTILSVGLWL